MKARNASLAALLLCCASLAPAEGGPGLRIGGGLESRPFLGYAWGGAADGLSYGAATTLDLELLARGPADATDTTAASAGASVEASLFSGGDAAYRLRTAWAKLDWGWAAATLGRQVLNYGRGALWSPVDLFSSLEAGTLSTTRRGVDALRLAAPLGQTGLLDLVAAPSTDPSEGSYSGRLSGLLVPGLDSGALAAYRGSGPSGGEPEWLCGADFKLDLEAGSFNPSLYGEALCALPAGGGQPRMSAAAGGDWSAGDFVFAAEYYYNGGLPRAEDPYLAGTHNAYASLSFSPSELLSLRCYGLCDFGDELGRAVLALSASAAQNADLSLYLAAAKTGPEACGAELGADLAVKF